MSGSPKWEYTMVEEQGWDHYTRQRFLQDLNSRGQDGWEVVSVRWSDQDVPVRELSGQTVVALLKRQL